MAHIEQEELQAPERLPENGQLVCPNCGASHAVDEARCPYCGALNPVGAEKAYMDELADIKSDTGQLAQDAQRTFTTDLKHNTKRIVILIAVVVAVIAALFVVTNSLERSEEQQAVQNYQARESFRERYFPELDRLYKEGDDDALSWYVWNLADDPGFDALYSWEHYGYLEVHDDWEALKVAENAFAQGEGDIDDYTWAVSVAMRLARLETSTWRPSSSLTEQEEARVADYRAFAWVFLANTLQMDNDEITTFAKSVLDSEGDVDTKMLKHELELRLRQLGTLK